MDLEFNRKMCHYSVEKLRCLNSKRYLLYFSYLSGALLAIGSRAVGFDFQVKFTVLKESCAIFRSNFTSIQTSTKRLDFPS